MHGCKCFLPHESLEIFADVSGVVAGNVGAPASADSFSPVHQRKGENGQVVVGFDVLTLLFQVVQHRVVIFMEEVPGHIVEHGEDVTRTCRFFSSLISCTELTVGHEQVHVIRANIVLGHSDNGGAEGLLSMVIRRVLSHIPRQLRHFNLVFEFPLEAGEEDLALARFESVAERGDGAGTVGDGEEDQLFVDEVLVAQVRN
mmetsp:Transcript_18977/g.13770  ORF Transcript_18977/g.13770 Transcript_18977/m.13770 type:complete len:201 (-) Transcript_18977:715-1317(-)